ncbi:hypothetical protein [Streptomyces cinereoruber]
MAVTSGILPGTYDRDRRPVETADIVVPAALCGIVYELPVDRKHSQADFPRRSSWLPYVARAVQDECLRCPGERVSAESTAVEWFTPAEIDDRMAETYAILTLSALNEAVPHVRTHGGRYPLEKSA